MGPRRCSARGAARARRRSSRARGPLAPRSTRTWQVGRRQRANTDRGVAAGRGGPGRAAERAQQRRQRAPRMRCSRRSALRPRTCCARARRYSAGGHCRAGAPCAPWPPPEDFAARARWARHCAHERAPRMPSHTPAAPRASPPDYICQGPLLEPCGLTPDGVAAQLPTWERLGRRLAQQLGFDHDAMDDVQRCARGGRGASGAASRARAMPDTRTASPWAARCWECTPPRSAAASSAATPWTPSRTLCGPSHCLLLRHNRPLTPSTGCACTTTTCRSTFGSTASCSSTGRATAARPAPRRRRSW
jgi:hypothetical protein